MNKTITYLLAALALLIVPLASATAQAGSLAKVPITTCSGSADLYVYSGSDPFQNPDTSFTVDHDQLLIFTRGDYTTGLTLGGVAGANAVVNGDFESGTSPWQFYSDASASYTTAASGPSSANAAKVAITTPGSNVQLYQAGITLLPNTNYRLTFSAKSSTGHDMDLYIHKHTSPYTSYGLNGVTVDLTTSWKQFSIDFTTSGFASTVNDARLRFWLAPYDAAGDVYWIDDVSLTPLSSSTPSLIVDSASPFPVKIYEAPTTPGQTVSVDATVNGGRGARGIQAYLSQDSAHPVYDAGSFQLVYDDAAQNVMHLTPGTYQFVFYDKYTNDQPGAGTDNRNLHVTITGPGGTVFDQAYTQPKPVGDQGVVIDTFTAPTEGDYTLSLSTEDSIYWGLVNCKGGDNNVPEFGSFLAIGLVIAGLVGVVIFARRN